MAMNASFEQPSGNQQSVEYDTIGEYETIVKTRPGPAAEVSPRQGSSIPGPAVGAGPGAMMNNRPGTTQEPICNPRCMLIVAIIYGILLAVIIAMLCFVMIQNFQTKANQDKTSDTTTASTTTATTTTTVALPTTTNIQIISTFTTQTYSTDMATSTSTASRILANELCND